MENNCYECTHKRNVPGDAHIACAKPDPELRGNIRAIQKGWWYYPMLFDPIWALNKCKNFEEK